jgi:alpha-beta hydrolase superfamily lysophospholipase
MRRKIVKLIRSASILLAFAAVTFFAIRIYDIQRGPPLARWHTYVPHELRAKDLDAADWPRYLAEEARIFATLRTEVTQKLGPEYRIPLNRYFDGSPLYPAHFSQDFNRSFVLEPAGAPVGAAVLLHGLTDSPYSQRHIARIYRDHGFVAIVIRLPAHGTVPAALTDVEWEDWSAATRLAVREARRRTAPKAPLHLVGYSNGGALALKYALDAIGDPQQARPDRLVLISPMIGITRFARFAGLAALPAVLPAFAKATWLSVVPEFNPFKYNSFPVNAARQSYRLTRVLQDQTARYARSGQLAHLPPIITFQSVVDFTVTASAVVTALYAHLPANGSELVLFDVNRSVKFGPLLRRSADTALTRLLPEQARSYRTTIITNEDTGGGAAIERTVEAGAMSEHDRPLGLTYPASLYSLSHVALPFPLTDSLYGLTPDPTESFGINLGALVARGERNVLITSLDTLLRATSNPFFPYMVARIAEGIDRPTAGAAEAAVVPVPAGGGEAGDEASRLSLDEVRAFIRSLMRDRSDASTEPP